MYPTPNEHKKLLEFATEGMPTPRLGSLGREEMNGKVNLFLVSVLKNLKGKSITEDKVINAITESRYFPNKAEAVRVMKRIMNEKYRVVISPKRFEKLVKLVNTGRIFNNENRPLMNKDFKFTKGAMNTLQMFTEIYIMRRYLAAFDLTRKIAKRKTIKPINIHMTYLLNPRLSNYNSRININNGNRFTNELNNLGNN